MPSNLMVMNQTTGEVLAVKVTLAHTFGSRLVGLLGTKSLDAGRGLLLKPCNQVHQLGMRYPILAVYLAEDDQVLRTVVLSPWQIGPLVRRARSVLELPAGLASKVQPGERLRSVEIPLLVGLMV